ncbi:MAG: NlpC/P60 family protein [Desulfosarcinaceae bacterium]
MSKIPPNQKYVGGSIVAIASGCRALALKATIKFFPRWPIRSVVLLLIFALCTGCAETKPQYRPGSADSVQVNVPDRDPKLHRNAQAIPSTQARLRSEVRQWRGTPHKMGGTGRSGVDCSGFVQRLYRDIFNRSIPRSTALQVKSGRPVDFAHLSPGDLVFFRPPYKIRHVGIYLGKGEFAHASTSKGVMISKLSESYWRDCYWTARRYRSN